MALLPYFYFNQGLTASLMLFLHSRNPFSINESLYISFQFSILFPFILFLLWCAEFTSAPCVFHGPNCTSGFFHDVATLWTSLPTLAGTMTPASSRSRSVVYNNTGLDEWSQILFILLLAKMNGCWSCYKERWILVRNLIAVSWSTGMRIVNERGHCVKQ